MNSDGMGDNGINRFRCGKLTVRTAELPMCYAKSVDHTGADGNRMRQATKGHKFHACMKIYDFVERKTPKSSHFSKKNERI